ncbi:MAG: hypothetical protein EA428_00170, partial [Spirochaetaceae bacterium]
KRFEDMAKSIDQRFQQVDQRFESVDKRFEHMAKSMDRRFEDMHRYSSRWFTVISIMLGIITLGGGILGYLGLR